MRIAVGDNPNSFEEVHFNLKNSQVAKLCDIFLTR
jgi:hypothetical protein